MLSSNALAEIIPDDLWRRYADIETSMILSFSERARSSDFLDLWEKNNKKAEKILKEDIEAIIRKNSSGIKNELSSTISNIGNKALAGTEAHLKKGVKAGALPNIGPLSKSKVISDKLATAYKLSLNKLNLTNTLAVNTVSKKFDDMVLMAVSGRMSLDDAVKMAVNDFAANGVKVAKYGSGREMEISSYVRMIIRTEMQNVATDLVLTRAKEYGNDLIQISAHAGARPRCFPYQGRVYSISGKSKKYPAFSSTSYGEPAGIFGINCSHFPTPFIPKIDREMTDEERDPAKTDLDKSNDQVYKESQEQRKNEREIRKLKRRIEALGTAKIDNTKAKQMLKHWQDRQKAFIKAANRTRRTSREAI